MLFIHLTDSELYKLAQEVVELIKEIVGKESFAEIYSKLQRKVSEKKEARKRKEAEEVGNILIAWFLSQIIF